MIWSWEVLYLQKINKTKKNISQIQRYTVKYLMIKKISLKFKLKHDKLEEYWW